MNTQHDQHASVRHFIADENGAAYTLSYVMVIPVYAILICMIIETVFGERSCVGSRFVGTLSSLR